MSDTKRIESALLALFPNGVPEVIGSQDQRDFLISVFPAPLPLSNYGTDRTAFVAAIAAIGGTEANLFLEAGAYSIDDDLTIPSNINIQFEKGAIITIASLKTLTISGKLTAGLYQIFDGAGTVAFGSGAVKEVCPQWWGAVGDGSTDDYTAINNALTVAVNSDIPLFFPPGNYKITTSPLVVSNGNRISIVGAGSDKSQIIQATTDIDLFQIGDTGGNTNGVSVRGLYVGTVAGTGNAFKLTLLHRSTFEDIYIPRAGNYGFYLNGCLLNNFRHCEVSVNLGTTIAGITGGALIGGGFFLQEEAGAGRPSNANTFLGCIMEGGSYGFHIYDGGGDANTILGGCAEGHDTYAIRATNISGLNVFGFYIEGVTSRTYLTGCKNCNINFSHSYGFDLDNCVNVVISGRVTGGLNTITANCVMCKVDEINLLHTGDAVRNYSETSDIGKGFSSTDPKQGAYGIYTRGFLLSENESLEYWAGGAPLPFKANAGGVTITQTGTGLGDTTKRSGDYAALVAKTDVGYLGLALAIPIAYRGQWISIECWVNNVAGQALVGFIGGAGANFYMFSPNVTAVWQKCQYSFYYASDKTFSVIFTNLSASTTDSFYIDDIKIWAERNPYTSEQILTLADDATPSILGGTCFLTGGTTTITDFDDGITGQVITIIAEHSLIITDGTNIFLNGSANWAMTATDTLTLRCKADNKWYEISRGDNGA